MIDNITTFARSKNQDYTFSIVIPSWNNLDYLKNCVEGINRHSEHQHQIIVFVNDGTDGTLFWLEKQKTVNLDFIHSKENAGICYGVNLCRALVKADFIVFMNDDMYALPGWDAALLKAIEGFDSKLFLASATMIEPAESGNSCVIVKDYGSDLDSFRKKELLQDYHTFVKEDWQGSTWPPIILKKEAWDLVGGFSTEFSPGMYSDPDLSLKLLYAGAREFMGVGSSLIYHFGSKSTRRFLKNHGRKTFIAKWGISSRIFSKDILRIGEPYIGPLPEPDMSLNKQFKNRMKRIFSI